MEPSDNTQTVDQATGASVRTDGQAPQSVYKFPWQDRPAGSQAVVWRYRENPVISRSILPGVLGVYNSAVVTYGDGYVGVFRVEDTSRFPRLHVGWSEDAIEWQLEPRPIDFANQDHDPCDYAYDPRVVALDGYYYVTWCGGLNGPTISVARTKDFRTFERLPNAFLPFNRNGVLFPRKIDGRFYMLSRPSDDGHTPFGDIYISQSPDMIHWGHHKVVMRRGGDKVGTWWQRTKIGAGPIPVETDAGWLMIYHGVMDTCNGFVYSMGAAILALDDPSRVLYRTKDVLMAPEADYEVSGHVPNVVFPCAALHDKKSDRIAIYYGAADTSTCLAFGRISEIVEFTKQHSVVF